MTCPDCRAQLDGDACRACGWRRASARGCLPKLPNAVIGIDIALARVTDPVLAKELRMLRDDAAGGTVTPGEVQRRAAALTSRFGVECDPYEITPRIGVPTESEQGAAA